MCAGKLYGGAKGSAVDALAIMISHHVTLSYASHDTYAMQVDDEALVRSMYTRDVFEHKGRKWIE